MVNRLDVELGTILDHDANFARSLAIVRSLANAQREIFLVGGAVYRILIRIIHGDEVVNLRDHDFIVEGVPHTFPGVPEGWCLGKTSHGQHRLTNIADPTTQIDLVRLQDAINTWDDVPVDTNDPEACINSYLSKTPLDVQSVAYSLTRRKLYISTALTAIVRREIRIHHLLECEHYCRVKGISKEQYLQMKARTLGFSAII